MAEEKIDTGKLREVASTIDQKNRELTSIVSEAQSQINSLQGTYKGKAASSLYESFQSVKTKLDAVTPILTEYSNFLTQTAEDYEAAEAARQADNASAEN